MDAATVISVKRCGLVSDTKSVEIKKVFHLASGGFGSESQSSHGETDNLFVAFCDIDSSDIFPYLVPKCVWHLLFSL